MSVDSSTLDGESLQHVAEGTGSCFAGSGGRGSEAPGSWCSHRGELVVLVPHIERLHTPRSLHRVDPLLATDRVMDEMAWSMAHLVRLSCDGIQRDRLGHALQLDRADRLEPNAV